MEGNDLTVVDLNTKDFLRQMGNCIQYGLPCLLQVSTYRDRRFVALQKSRQWQQCCGGAYFPSKAPNRSICCQPDVFQYLS